MEKFVKGMIVVLLFPFSDLRSAKKRPALVVATLSGDDVICCQITSEARFDNYAVILKEGDFKVGSLQQTSVIRPNRLFTADRSLISYVVGSLNEAKVKEVEEELVAILRA